MKEHLITLVERAVSALAAASELALPANLPQIELAPPRHAVHGDFSCNIALLLAKHCRLPPMAVAARIAEALPTDPHVARVEVAAPGFLNFHLRRAALFGIIQSLLDAPEACGHSARGAGQRVQLEFVSANPTGPLHVGHGRGAAYGAALANLLRAAGYEVETEYYVNDAGRQMDILALSVWLRYLERAGPRDVDFPPNAYQGDYIRDIAAALELAHGRRLDPGALAPPSRGSDEDDEARLDNRIAQCRGLLGEADYRALHAHACAAILDGIRTDLAAFGVEFDTWCSERSLVERGLFEAALTALRATGHVYTRDGAEWFAATRFGDEKDRVLIRENGIPTYFAADVAYHLDKYRRGFDHLINIWGADHHGYIPRVKSTLAALGLDGKRLEILLVQFASLYRGGQKVQMSTRSGEFVTLEELVREVGVDAARYFYSSRRSDQPLDFDLDLARAQSQDNPVYYLQYAHARICSVFRQVDQQGRPFKRAEGLAGLDLLAEEKEHQLAGLLGRYSDVVASAAEQREPHAVANFLRELATAYHAFYNSHKINTDDDRLRQARLALCAAVRLVLAHGLGLLGVSAPLEM